jgi:hypothetical protein
VTRGDVVRYRADASLVLARGCASPPLIAAALDGFDELLIGLFELAGEFFAPAHATPPSQVRKGGSGLLLKSIEEMAA